jgi:hypothetical protein
MPEPLDFRAAWLIKVARLFGPRLHRQPGLEGKRQHRRRARETV